MRARRERMAATARAAAIAFAVALARSGASQSDEAAHQPRTASNLSLAPISGSSTAYFELPIPKLKEQVPALRGLRYDSSQERLSSILDHVARTIADVLPRLPNLISRESVYGFQSPRDTSAAGGLPSAQPWNREFKYLILSHHHGDGSTTLEELRVDSKGKPVDAPGLFAAPRGYGFAYQWLFFSAANQHDFRFRYLGEQSKDGRKTYVVGFAQDPQRVQEPAYFQAGAKTEPFFFQGVLWIDQSTFNIAALRTDLLAPLPDVNLRRLTTQLTFRSVPIHGYNAVFWLPSEVIISCDQGGGPMEESHRYSDYHLFHAETRIVTGP